MPKDIKCPSYHDTGLMLSSEAYELVPYDKADEQAFLEMILNGNAAWVENQGWPLEDIINYPPRYLMEHLIAVKDRYDYLSYAYLVAFKKDASSDGKPNYIGEVVFNLYPPHVSTSYFIKPSCRQQGHASTLYKGLVECLVKNAETFGVTSVLAHCYPDNIASLRVIEKAGLRNLGLKPYEGIYPSYVGEELVHFSLLVEEKQEPQATSHPPSDNKTRGQSRGRKPAP